MFTTIPGLRPGVLAADLVATQADKSELRPRLSCSGRQAAATIGVRDLGWTGSGRVLNTQTSILLTPFANAQWDSGFPYSNVD